MWSRASLSHAKSVKTTQNYSKAFKSQSWHKKGNLLMFCLRKVSKYFLVISKDLQMSFKCDLNWVFFVKESVARFKRFGKLLWNFLKFSPNERTIISHISAQMLNKEADNFYQTVWRLNFPSEWCRKCVKITTNITTVTLKNSKRKLRISG